LTLRYSPANIDAVDKVSIYATTRSRGINKATPSEARKRRKKEEEEEEEEEEEDEDTGG